jgi:hypothetical protein
MAIDWRGLFNSINVPYRDQGKNWSQGNINIKCPFCIDDPSFHLSVAEDKPVYFCRRDARHKGGNLIFMLSRLGISKSEAVLLISRHFDGKRYVFEQQTTPIREIGRAVQIWGRFVGAETSFECCEYLRSRHFINPEIVCRLYDLRMAREGSWARRVLMPFRDDDGDIVSWVGRAIDPDREPRYKMEDVSLPPLLYMPRLTRRILLIFEGPFDALKIAVASEGEDVSTLAILGKHLSVGKLLLLNRLAQDAGAIYWTPDQGTPLGETNAILAAMRQANPGKPMTCLRLPSGMKDAGEFTYGDALKWISTIL